jgi:ribosomal protein S18 acetylase RimI-like enzyme
MTVVIRPADVDDADELAQVGDLTVEAYLADGVIDPSDGYADHLRDATSRAREAELYVAELPTGDAALAESGGFHEPSHAGGVVGTVTFCPPGSSWSELARPGEGEFRMLAVAPGARRRGVALALVGLCIERSRELGLHAVVLSSMPTQQGAHRIYDRLGFRRTPALDWVPEPGVDLWAFRLDL